MQIKVIVFDLYNTLVKIHNNQHFFAKIYRDSKDGFGLSLTDFTSLLMENEVEDVFHQLSPDFKNHYDQNIQILEDELPSIEVFEETIEVLEELKKDHQLYLISNLASPYKGAVTQLKLDRYFSQLIYSCDVGFQKPNPAIFKLVEKHSGFSKNEILMVGDSFKSDVQGAQQMGWKYLRINRKSDNTREKEIKSLREISDYLK